MRHLGCLVNPLAKVIRQLRNHKKRNATLPQVVIESTHLDGRGHPPVGNHQVNTMRRQVGQQSIEGVFPTNDTHRLRHFQSRCQQAICIRFRYYIRHAQLE